MKHQQNASAANKSSRLFRITKWVLGLTLTVGIVLAFYITFIIIPDLPKTDSLKDIQYQIPLSVYSTDNKLIARFGEKKRIPIHYDGIPKIQIDAFLAAEDSRFFTHSGVDYIGLSRAVVQLILTGEKRQGGSTITMQVARNFFLSRKKTYTRKLREIILSYFIEHDLSKKQILALYLNKIYLGHRSYGIAAAADVYYGKTLAELTLAQQAMIAGLPKAPSAYNPITNPTRAKTRRDHILNRMLTLEYITQEQFDIAIIELVTAELNNQLTELSAPYVAEMVRDSLYKEYGNAIYTSGMRVHTTIHSELQLAANYALRKSLHDYDKRHGYRGILSHIDNFAPTNSDAKSIKKLLTPYKSIGETQPALVSEIVKQTITVITRNGSHLTIDWPNLKWAWPYINENKQGKQPTSAAEILAVGDIVRIRNIDHSNSNPVYELAQVPAVSGSIVAMQPEDGSLAALVGGYDYYHSKFNRAFQAKRQPGSGFKPFLYTAALSKDYTTATLINDAPVVFDDAGLERQWRPENYSGKFFGPTRLREALTHSRNLVSIRILRDIGVNYVRNFATRFGFDPSTLPKNLSLALGSGSANTYQMASAYSVLANGGFKVSPYFIERIESATGEILFQANPELACDNCIPNTEQINEEPRAKATEFTDISAENILPPAPPVIAKRVISPQLHFLINSLLRNVVKNGTGRRALSLGRSDLAGKTGTTNEQRDAWFNGFTPSMVAVAWVGFDNSKPLGNRETGGRAALPMWIDFMREALKNTPEQNLSQPDGIASILIDPQTGLKSEASNPGAVFEYFRENNIPKSGFANAQNGSQTTGQQQELDDLF